MTRAKDISKILTDADISGTLDVAGETTLATHLNLGDSDKIKLGASGDLEIYHDGTHSYVSDEGTGNLILRGSNELLLGTTAGQDILKGTTGGDVKIYHNNSEKLATTSSGVTVTGGVTTTTASSIEGGVVFNESSADVDFRVEGNGDANLFICDAGNDDVYIHRNNSTVNTTNFGTVFNSGDGVSSFKTGADATGSEVAVQIHGNAGKCFIYGNGNVNNDNGTFGNFSDQTLKENIVDAQSQWADIKALQIRNFNLISNPNLTQLGVVAQELESSGMNGLVEDLIIDDEKNTKKAVKTSVLYMKGLKALQEAMTRIETLEARITALESA